MSSLNPGSCLGVLLCSLKAVLFEWEMKVPNNCTIGWFSRGGQGEAESYQFLMHASSISETRNPKFLKIRYGVYFWVDLEFFFGGGLFLQILFWSPYRVHKIQVFRITVTEYWSLRNAMYNNKKSNSRVIFIAFNICNIRGDIHLQLVVVFSNASVCYRSTLLRTDHAKHWECSFDIRTRYGKTQQIQCATWKGGPISCMHPPKL